MKATSNQRYLSNSFCSVNSSWIAGVDHIPKDDSWSFLVVYFKDGDGGIRDRVWLGLVPEELRVSFMSASSPGKAFNSFKGTATSQMVNIKELGQVLRRAQQQTTEGD
jgi:hypothetical protein